MKRMAVPLGFTGGTLACSPRCRLDTAACDPTFFVPGGGPPRPECLATWRVTNAGQRPGGDGKAAVRHRCHDGAALPHSRDRGERRHGTAGSFGESAGW